MTTLDKHLDLPRCPHCYEDAPTLEEVLHLETTDRSGQIHRKWKIYKCRNCGGLITAWALDWEKETVQIFPGARSPDDTIPARPRAYLFQARESLHSPAGSVMLAASAVDAMLKLKGYKEGSLYSRLEQTVKDHLITAEMERWAHLVRLDVSDQRHSDGNYPLPGVEDAMRCIRLAHVIAEYLFVIPEKVHSGIKDSGG